VPIEYLARQIWRAISVNTTPIVVPPSVSVMVTGSPARIVATNAGVRTGNTNATRRSNRIAGRPPTTGGLSPTARTTKKPRKQPSRRNELNANRIARAVEEDEQGSQPAGELTSPAEALANEPGLQPANEHSLSAEVSADEQRTHTASGSTPPAELPASEQRIQTANERTPAAKVSASANNGMHVASADGSLHRPKRRYDDELEYPDQPLSDDHGDGVGQDGREIDGSLHSQPRESQPLRFLSQNDDFWEYFARNEATCQSLMEIDVKLRQSDADKNDLDEAITRKFKRDLDIVMNDSGRFSAAKEEAAVQDISRIPDLYNKHRELQASKLAAEKLQAERWMHLLSLAEIAFVNAEMLTPAKETQKAEGEEGGGEDNGEEGREVPEQELPEPEAPLKSDSEVLKDGVRATLHAAKEACLKAREDFEGARKFSNEEIEQLPQPADEDVLGAARVEKLARLTHALLVAEEAFNSAKKRAREVGITRPHDRTADFTDDSDDGSAASLFKRAVVQSHDRVARVQGWTGLYLDPQETQTAGVQTFLPLTLQRLRPVRLGEDSFDLTEADGRTRDRINTMAAVTKSLRGNAEFPQADKDTPMIDRDR
jgi:hypothetical protein